MPWYHAVAEREHDIQNPTSAEKIRLLGERMQLERGSRVLDVAAGRGGPALVLADAFGCRITCVEQYGGFLDAAVARSRDRGLHGLLEFVHGDAREVDLGDAYDAALCLGASFVWDGLDGTLDALKPLVRPRGHVAVGEPYWRRWPAPDEGTEKLPGYAPLDETIRRFERAGLDVVGLIAASEDDWDRYETLHWQSVESWLLENVGDPGGAEIRGEHEAHRAAYLRWQRESLGWAIVVGRTR